MKIHTFRLNRTSAVTHAVAFFVLISVFLCCISKVASARALTADALAKSSVGIIIIDPGHGGEDCGAVGINGVYEKDLNMQISLKLGEYLSAAGYEVVYTRTEDRLLYTDEQNIKGMRKIYDLKNRVEIANSYSDALFVSIHMNSFGAESCSGLQVYYSPSNEEARNAAERVQSSVVERLQKTNSRKTKAGDGIYVLENTAIPSILIECGFISNSEECRQLSEKEYQKELSFAILCGIIAWKSENP